MRRVRVKYSAAYHPRSPQEGLFHGWGLEDSPDPESHGQITAGIVEFERGRIALVEPDLIQFLDPPEKIGTDHA